MYNILVVEDDYKLNKLMCTVLEKNGYKVFPANDGVMALDLMDEQHVDLIISDIMMPSMDGYELTDSLRGARYDTPILMVTARDRFSDMEQGFKMGADDYMVKPINMSEMLLRIRALLRRAQIAGDHRITFAGAKLDYDSLSVVIDGTEQVLPQKEFQILYKLMSFPGKIFTRQSLMDEFWGLDSESDIRTVDVHINRLRERFKDQMGFKIITVRGLGYKVEEYG